VDESTCDFMRGVPGAFRAGQAAVRMLSAAGLAPQIIMTVMRENAAQVEAMIRLAEHLGAGSVKFNIVQPTGRGERVHGSQAGLDVPALVALGRRVDRELAAATKLALIFDCPSAFRPLARIAAEGGSGTCGILGILGVISTGHYALCGIGEQLSEMVFGTVEEGTLGGIWRKHPVLARLRAGLPRSLQGVCGRCLHRRQCQGSCIAQNYYRTGSLWAAYWMCEEAEAAGLFPLSRLSTLVDVRPRSC
jgi:SynChlorMet cassette radical SAM/SPASM protein ScmF